MDDSEKEIIKEQKEELKNLLVEAKQYIHSAKNDVQNVKQIVSSIEAYNKQLDDIRIKIQTTENEITSNLEKSKTDIAEIYSTKGSSDEQLTQIKTTLTSVQENIRLMSEAYAGFEVINSQIKNPENGLAYTFSNASKLKEEIGVLKNLSDEQLMQIKTVFSTIQANIQTMTDAYTSFVEIKAKIDDPEIGLLKILEVSETTKQEIVALKKQSEALFQEIKKFRDESQSYTKEIEEFKKVAEENKNSIEEYEKQSEDYKTKIAKIYQIATDSTLANSFDERKKELGKSKKFWLWVLGITTALLIAEIFIILGHILFNNSGSIDGYTWYRLTFTSPLIFAVTFASIQYNKERNLLEKYAFKSVTALSLEGYTSLLMNVFGDEKNTDKILGFVLDSMTSIYKEPHETVKESKISLGIDGKVATLKTDFTKTMEDTKNAIVDDIKEEFKKNQTPSI